MDRQGLFLPGWAVPVSHYREAAPALWREARYLDPGFFGEGGFTAAAYRSRVREALVGPTVIFAHSLGSMLALRAAAETDAVRALVLFNPFARFVAGEDYSGQPERNIRTMQLQLRRDPVGLLRNFSAAVYRPETAPETDWEALRPDAAALAEGLRVLMTEDVRELLPQVRCPVMIFQGEADAISGDGQTEYLAGALSGSRLTVISNAGHALPLTRAAECGAAAEAFIRAKEAG